MRFWLFSLLGMDAGCELPQGYSGNDRQGEGAKPDEGRSRDHVLNSSGKVFLAGEEYCKLSELARVKGEPAERVEA
jgi:hypothetical protein